MRRILTGGLVATALLVGVGAWTQQADKPGMTASLVEPEKSAARGWATVVVKVSGVTLSAPL